MLSRRIARAARRRGDRARDARDWAAAAAGYRRYLARMPDDAAIRVQLGHVLAEAGDLDGADRVYRAAAALTPDDADLLLCWGHARKRAGDADAARRLYRESAALNGNADAARELAALTPHETPPEPEPAPAPAPERRFVGRVEHVRARTVSGHAAGPEPVEFRDGDRVVGHAVPDGAVWQTELDVDRDSEVTAWSDGIELDGSPFWIGPPRRHHDAAPPAWSVRLEVVKPFVMAPGELALFITHSRTGAMKPHVAPYLRALREEGVQVLLIAVTDRPLDLPQAVLDLVAGAVVRENAGYDFAAWAHAIRLYPEVYGASILYLVNDSLVGPAAGGAFAAMLARVRASTADLVGLTESHEYRWHLQSYFLALKPHLLAAFELQGFFGDVRVLEEKDAVIRAYEVRFASAMERAGHRVETLFPSHVALNPTLRAWRSLLDAGFPFMKLLPLRGAFPEVDMTGWREALAAAGFDLALIDATVEASAQEVPRDDDDRLTVHPVPWDDGTGRALKVAFYGPWNYDNGLGAASRGMVAALRRSGVRLNLRPIEKPFHVHRPLTPAVDVAEFTGPADIAVVHLNPDSWFLLTDAQRDAIRHARRRIGYWVWEMGHVPPAWRHDFSSVDRIWAPSRYCAELFAGEDEAPVAVIPHAVPLPEPRPVDRPRALAALGLPADARVILYIFDGSSYLVRKNPAALVRAFAASGLGERGWRLVLKTKHLMDRPDEGAAFRALAEATDAVTLLDRSLPDEGLAELLALADIYASPHCSEGFGLTIAEAMAAGKPVVATDFGGSTDVLDATTGYPVKAHGWRLADDHGHYTAGGVWARVDEPALAAALVRAAADVEAGDGRRGTAARARIAERLSYEAVGRLIADSFAEVMTGRGASPAVPRLALRLLAGTPFERADLGEGVRAVALAADGAPLPWGDPGNAQWIAFAPTGSRAAPRFGAIVRDHARTRPDVAVFYADDVAAEADEAIDQLRLKPELDLTLLAAQDYVGAPVIVRAVALAALGGLDPARRTAAIPDLLFRAQAAGLSVARIPEVLLAHPGRRVRATIADHRAMLAAQPTLAAYDVVDGPAPATLALARRFTADTMPHVTLVVPTRRSALADGGLYVERLLAGVAAADWPMDRLTVLVGDDVAGEPAFARADWPFALRRIETPRAQGEPFNYAAKMNRLWRAAETEQVVFLNDDVRPLDAGWLKALLSFAVDETVGGVGARLLFEDGRLQHAGIAPHGAGAAHVWVYRRRVEGSYQDWARTQREWSMVTGAVFATRRSLLERVDGFDEGFALEFNDTDLCLRLRLLGYRIVCTPMAELVHAEKVSRGEGRPPGDHVARFLAKWKPWIDRDPAWHLGLRLDRLDMTPRIDGDAWYL